MAVHIILQKVGNSCTKCQHTRYLGTRKAGIQTLMICQQLTLHAQSFSPKYPGVNLATYFSGSAQCMGTAMGSILLQGDRVGKTPFHLCTSIVHTCQKTFIMTACQLSEYCLNREPELFKNIWFWHDLFHFIGHMCGVNFKSGRVLEVEYVNTEICEQVNSFLQCIKYTGTHLSQNHFTFFLQFFLCLKTKNYKKQASIAVTGLL